MSGHAHSEKADLHRPHFRGMEPAGRKRPQTQTHPKAVKTFAAGSALFATGDDGAHCYRIISGRVEITSGATGDGDAEPLVCEAGEIVGEMSAIGGGAHTASAIALETVTCVAYTADEIARLLETDIDEATGYVRTLSRRIRRSSRRMMLDIIGQRGDRAGTGGVISLEPAISMVCSVEEILSVLENNPEEAMRFVRTLVANLRASACPVAPMNRPAAPPRHVRQAV